MAQIINLNQARKAAIKIKSKLHSVENAAKFGRSRVEKQREALTQLKAEQDLAAHKREGPKDER